MRGARRGSDLPLPDIQSGTFGIADLHLGFVFELQVVFRYGTAAAR